MALASVIVLLVLGLASPASAQQVLGRYDNFTVVEVIPPPEPGGPGRILYLIEDPPPSSAMRFAPRRSGMESAAFAGVWVLLVGAGFAVARRARLLRLVGQPTG